MLAEVENSSHHNFFFAMAQVYRLRGTITEPFGVVFSKFLQEYLNIPQCAGISPDSSIAIISNFAQNYVI